MIEETKKLLEVARASFDPAHLSFHDRHQLIQELERGWTTKEQYEAIDALVPLTFVTCCRFRRGRLRALNDTGSRYAFLMQL